MSVKQDLVYALEQKCQHFFTRKDSCNFAKALANLTSLDVSFSLELPPTDIPSHGVTLTPDTPLTPKEREILTQTALALKPWRKGPFRIDTLFVDTEWQSFMKFNLLAPYLNLTDKEVLDMGCNNGYYLFEMLRFKPKALYGFDPSAVYAAQFNFLNHLAKTDIHFYPLGIEDLRDFSIAYEQKFDCIMCLGVLYHRSDPIATLKNLSFGLKRGGELFLDCLLIESDKELCLCPKKSYAKMSNVYFIPSLEALKGWCERAGFGSFEILGMQQTTTQEQRKTPWIDTLSLEDFLDSQSGLTIEGYPPPLRGYFRLIKT
ncbi:tRNA 5-methoxyuridine(34)/uridine 5-oxyacetic acid(34) synthase CmoB [Helicobacter equorum]|uniref:tRNA 5-methoxyuridine(34)/uridine 5-oxyacetic acid(34) synthase CmoB n=1 Tax=Helicobacter equorum TaxID=361872 RepID=A0A3D8IS12_9HELI|nr:tRNA 5-methoxyuridine(34)/uridine 5-oxyacetic acid(34) synthase CmoB [Helicobacter equorum]RDU67780.1 tRNA 5-methoxyuridine(34)/uridine 5-oxyacetic acid(34) synthase CmoB [Helicobacter equorum]